MRRLQVGALAPEEVERAYPLVQAVTPEVPLEQWLGCAAWFLARRAIPCGILRAKDEQGYLAGLCCYRVIDVVDQGRSANADRVIALDLIDPAPVAEALVRGLEQEAERQRCDAVQVALFRSNGGREPSWLLSVLRRHGYQRAGSTMSKILRPKRGQRRAQA